ncbi:MAG: glycine--tRNA ligase subunit beta [Gammaproteobacteria bacterium]|nr:glycine--tRNA ligase subunit beta [Gammaproteobacteria bacterium]MCW9005581.1 glycine--tRNA ligase subunit beta [Gammaproteobacteria bacterium]
MSTKDLLIEIGTEELPPKALNKLSAAFTQSVEQGLKDSNVTFRQATGYAAPRRLAIIVTAVEESQPDRDVEKRGPSIQAAYDGDGNPTKAAQGFARSCGVNVDELTRLKTDKGEWLVFRENEKGKQAVELIAGIVNQALAKLPIPKRMRWGDHNEEFVRPVHWVTLLFGSDIVEAEILGIKTGNKTYGHRFHYPQAISLNSAEEYLSKLENPGYVIVDTAARKNAIMQQVEQQAEQLGGRALIDDDLLDEVTALVEWPVALAGDFDEHFLEVPAESLISSMQDHQKYFPVVDSEGKLMANFITISNIDSADMSKVKQGNERVIRPRLSDAAFFWEQDCRQPLETHIDSLDKVVFQNKLGSLGDKSRRVAKIAEKIAEALGENKNYAHRAGLLSKCDLMTNMVFEFTDLQGIMGRYYAINDNEPGDVAIALDEQYMPRFAGDSLPETSTGQILALSDKLDTLLGIFAIGQKPTGEKDPFALRRAALGVLRILIERNLMLDLKDMLAIAASTFQDTVDAESAIEDVVDFILDRLRVYYLNQDVSIDVYDAVAVLRPTCPMDFDRRIVAVNAFKSMQEAESLAAANKRIQNILKKIEGGIQQAVSEKLLTEAAEKKLHEQLTIASEKVMPMFDQGDYKMALQELAGLRETVDAFFDDVMVMVDNEAVKNNRIALLSQLAGLFIRVADLSRLQS